MAARNPYLILGVDFGASADTARRHFALAARRIRREGGRWSREDLTWALHEIEATDDDPQDSVWTFRVPADPSAFDAPGGGLYRPAPIPLARRSPPTSADEVAQLRSQAARELLDVALAAGANAIDPSTLDVL